MRKLIAPLLLVFVLFGCGTIVPETGVERYVAADGAYKALIVTVKDGIMRGVIKGETAVKIKALLTTAKVALDAWALLPESPTAETATLVSLQAAREILRLAATGGST